MRTRWENIPRDKKTLKKGVSCGDFAAVTRYHVTACLLGET